jgi:uncharacterized membrane protein YeaQ/YmgE (transglycosylase-associated protein family)
LPSQAPRATVDRERARQGHGQGDDQGRQDKVGIISWIVLGAIAGFLANMVVGGYIAESVFHKGDVTGVNIESIAIALVGAIIVLFVWRALTRSRAS